MLGFRTIVGFGWPGLKGKRLRSGFETVNSHYTNLHCTPMLQFKGTVSRQTSLRPKYLRGIPRWDNSCYQELFDQRKLQPLAAQVAESLLTHLLRESQILKLCCLAACLSHHVTSGQRPLPDSPPSTSFSLVASPTAED